MKHLKPTYLIQFLLTGGMLMGLSGCALIPLDEIPDEPLYDRAPSSEGTSFWGGGGSNSGGSWLSSEPSSDAEYYQEYVERARENRDLVLGMDMSDVRSLWGEPRDVESAGDPRMGNQRWIYFDGLSNRWSLSSSRVIYFERGRVVGWESGQ